MQALAGGINEQKKKKKARTRESFFSREVGHHSELPPIFRKPKRERKGRAERRSAATAYNTLVKRRTVPLSISLSLPLASRV